MVEPHDPHEAAHDSAKGYDLAIACQRELRIRSHEIQPRPDSRQELRWWLEGPVANHELESVA